MCEIVRIGPLHAGAAARLIETSWFQHYRSFIPVGALVRGGRIQRDTKEQLLAPGTRAFLAFEEGGPVAAMITRRRQQYTEVEELFVLPRWRGRGIGEALLKHALQIAEDRGVRLRLGAMRANVKACRFYKRHGGRIIQLSLYGWGRGRFPAVDFEFPRKCVH